MGYYFSDDDHTLSEPLRGRSKIYKRERKPEFSPHLKVLRRLGSDIPFPKKLPPVVSKSPPSIAKQLRSISKMRFLHLRKAAKNKKMLVIKRKATT